MKKTITIIAAILLLSISVFSQTKLIEKYYDYYKTKIAERYSVLLSNFDMKHGYYQSWSQTGAVTAEGNYNNGVKVGQWTNRLDNNFVERIENYNQNGVLDGLQVIGDVANMSGKMLERYYSNGKLNGIYKTWSTSKDFPKVLKSEWSFVNGAASGVWKYYYDNGNLEFEGSFVDGKGQGGYCDGIGTETFKRYYSNGKLKDEGPFNGCTMDRNWEYSSPIINEKNDGTWKTYYDNGNLKSEGSNLNGNKNGIWKTYYDNGNLESEGSYFNELGSFLSGKIEGAWKYYYDNGKLKEEGSYLNGNKNGNWNYYKEDGKIEKTLNYIKGGDYKNGFRTGAWTIYFDQNWNETNDSMQRKYYRKIIFGEQGVPIGKINDYYITGEKQFEGYLLSGSPNGDCVYYYNNGNLNSEGKYDNGNKIGLWKDYYESGAKKSEINFPDGDGTYWSENGKIALKGTKGIEYSFDKNGELDKIFDRDRNQFLTKPEIQQSEIKQLLYYLGKGIPNEKPFYLTFGQVHDVSYSIFMDGPENDLFDNINRKYGNDPNFAFTNELKTTSETYGKYCHENDRDAKYKLGTIITDNLYKIVNNSRKVSNQINSINESRKKINALYTDDKANKVIFEKSETLYQSLTASCSKAEDSDAKIAILKDIQTLYDRMNILKSTDNAELIKQLKKSKSEIELKSAFGI
jgi:antitoxin component YwqK of YwqJK toxin-antitoxin module